jgi:hypothetical protein
VTNSSYPAGTTDRMIEDRCGPDEYEIVDDIIRCAYERATAEIESEHMANVHPVIRTSLQVVFTKAIDNRAEKYLDNYRTEGKFS